MSGPSLPAFVATSTSSRFPRDRIQLPMIVSDSPPALPSTHDE
nr:hypothetical protein [Conexibacter woesei]